MRPRRLIRRMSSAGGLSGERGRSSRWQCSAEEELPGPEHIRRSETRLAERGSPRQVNIRGRNLEQAQALNGERNRKNLLLRYKAA